ncbi:hypothetical protein Tco_0789655 [Tanacetum coccineum]
MVAFCSCVLVIEDCVLLKDLVAFCLKTTAFCLKTTAFCLKTTAFCFKTITAFCFKIWLRFASRPSLRFASRFGCVLLQDHHCVLLQDLVAFCFKTITAFCFNIWPRTYEDLSDTEKKRYDADVRATNIVLQGLPKDIYKLINHNIEAKAIWDNVKMLLAGSELTKEDRESQLYDEFERFKMLPGENINEYYVRFHKLVNDMRNIRMTMPNIQLNSKFVNNMSPEWDRFVTALTQQGSEKNKSRTIVCILKNNREARAAQDRLIIERITPATNDQLAFVSTVQPHAQSSHVQSHQYPSSSTNPQSPQYPQFPETSQIDSGYTQTDELLDNLTKQMALLANPQSKCFLRPQQSLRTSSLTPESSIFKKSGPMETGQVVKLVIEYGHIAQETILSQSVHIILIIQGQIAGHVDNQPVQDLALNEDNIFQADECDAFDSDVDDEPTAQSIFMANLSSVGSANPQAGPSNASILSEVHILENAIDHSISNQDEHEVHNKVQPSDVIDTTSVHMGNSNVTPYEQYLSDNDISGVPSCASSALNSVCVSPVNDAFVLHDPIATELKIYKEQVAIYEQRAKFELTEREQRMDDQMREDADDNATAKIEFLTSNSLSSVVRMNEMFLEDQKKGSRCQNNARLHSS